MKKLIIILLLFFIPSFCEGGVNFDGTNDSINLGNSLNFGTGAFSIACWFKKTDPYSGAGHLLRKWGPSWDGGYAVRTGDDTAYLLVHDDTGDSYTNYDASTPNENQWYHFVGVYDGNKNILIYINGNYDTGGATGNVDLTTNDTLYMGAYVPTAEHHAGKISEVAIWDIDLTSTEISLLYNSKVKHMPLQIQPTHLKAYWPLDDHPHSDVADSANGLVFKDLSGNGNNGTASGCNAQAERVLTYP